MKALYVLGAILLVFFLIGLIPVGADAAYNGESFGLAVRIWLFSIRLGSPGDKPEKEKRAKAKKSDDEGKNKKGLPPLPVIKILIENGYAMLCGLVSRLKVDILKIHFTSAFSDPSTAAMAYAAAGTAMDGLLRVGEGRIRHPDLRADVDFDGTSPAFDLRLCLTIRIHQIISAALRFGWGALRDYRIYKKEQ